MFLDYLNLDTQLINEIISAKEYKQYKKDRHGGLGFSNFSVAEYKKILPYLKNIFKDFGGGKLKRTAIFDYNSIKNDSVVVLSATDKRLMGILNSAGYEVSEESYRLGMAMKNNKAVVINDVVVSLQAKDLNKLIAQNEKTPNENIQKQIEAIQRLEDTVSYHLTLPYMLAQNSARKIVISMESRKIASQSTKTGWKSCMNLDEGMYRSKVMSGIEQGVIIAWLVKTGDEKSLDSPTARLLIKPMRDMEDPKEIIWKVDKVYGDAPSDFPAKVDSIFKKYSSTKESVFTLDDNKVYSGDNVGAVGVNISPEQEKEVERFYNDYRRSSQLAEKIEKLSKAQKLYYLIYYNYSDLKKLDFSKKENIDILYLVYMHEKRIITRIDNESDIRKISSGLTNNQKFNLINRFMSVGRNEDAINFIKNYSVAPDVIMKIVKGGRLSNAQRQELTDYLPRAYKRLMGKTDKTIVNSDTTIAEFLDMCYENGDSTDRYFLQMLKENPDRYRFPKILVDEMIKYTLKTNNEGFFQVIANKLNDDYLKTASKESLYRLFASDINNDNGHIYAGKDVIYKLGISNIVKLILAGKLTATKVLESFKNYEDAYNKFFINYLNAVDETDSKNMLLLFLTDYRTSNFELMSEEVYHAIVKALLRQKNASKDAVNTFTHHLINNSKLKDDAKKRIMTKQMQNLVRNKLSKETYANLADNNILIKRASRQMTEHYLRIVRGE